MISASIYDLTDDYTSTTMPVVDYKGFLNGPGGPAVPGNQLIGAFAAASTTLTAGATYDVLGTLFVPATKTLIIPAGTQLKFYSANSQLVIDGALTVTGTSGSRARFTSGRAVPARGDWSGILVRSAGTVIDYAVVEYADRALDLINANAIIRDSTIHSYLTVGISASGSSAATEIRRNYLNVETGDRPRLIHSSGVLVGSNGVRPCLLPSTRTSCHRRNWGRT